MFIKTCLLRKFCIIGSILTSKWRRLPHKQGDLTCLYHVPPIIWIQVKATLYMIKTIFIVNLWRSHSAELKTYIMRKTINVQYEQMVYSQIKHVINYVKIYSTIKSWTKKLEFISILIHLHGYKQIVFFIKILNVNHVI